MVVGAVFVSLLRSSFGQFTHPLSTIPTYTHVSMKKNSKPFALKKIGGMRRGLQHTHPRPEREGAEKHHLRERVNIHRHHLITYSNSPGTHNIILRFSRHSVPSASNHSDP